MTKTELNHILHEVEREFKLGHKHIGGCYGVIKPDLIHCDACKWYALKRDWLDKAKE